MLLYGRVSFQVGDEFCVKMKIFIDATGIVNYPTGLGKYTLYLLKALLGSYAAQFTVLHQLKLRADHPLFHIPNQQINFLSIDIPTVGPKRDFRLYNIRNTINNHDIFHCYGSYLPAFLNVGC